MSLWKVDVLFLCLFLAGVLLAFPLTFLICAALGAVVSRVERWLTPCPKCGRRSLKMIEAYLATVVIDGQRAPDSWSFYACEDCTAVLKWHRGEWKDLSDADRQILANRSPT